MDVEDRETSLEETREVSMERKPDHTAREKVLSTCELLEQIMLHLPLKDLIKAQRVDHAFKSIFDGSPGIKQALFLTPLPDVKVTFHQIAKPVDGGSPWRMKWTQETELGDPTWITGPHTKLVRFHADEGHPWADGATTRLDFRHKFIVPDRHEKPAPTCASASLQRMLPAQPAIRSSIYECGFACDHDVRITPIDPGGPIGHLLIADIKRTLGRHSTLCPNCTGVSRSWAWDGNEYVDMVEDGTSMTGFEMLAELKDRVATEASPV